MNSDVLKEGDLSQIYWIEIALNYLPENIRSKEGQNLSIISVGELGACHLPQQYREREIVLLSDWLYPPEGVSEGDPTARFFIIAVLHEVAHAVCGHKSPLLDKLTDKERQDQENEALNLSINWFNQHVESRQDGTLKPIKKEDFHKDVDRYRILYSDFNKFRSNWHSI